MNGEEELKKLIDIYIKLPKECRLMWISFGNLLLATQQVEKKS